MYHVLHYVMGETHHTCTSNTRKCVSHALVRHAHLGSYIHSIFLWQAHEQMPSPYGYVSQAQHTPRTGTLGWAEGKHWLFFPVCRRNAFSASAWLSFISFSGKGHSLQMSAPVGWHIPCLFLNNCP